MEMSIDGKNLVVTEHFSEGEIAPKAVLMMFNLQTMELIFEQYLDRFDTSMDGDISFNEESDEIQLNEKLSEITVWGDG